MPTCLICGVICDKSTDLEAQTNITFLLQEILGVPRSKYVEYLDRLGNPCEWINLCPKDCHPLISSCLDFHNQINKHSNIMREIKERTEDAIRQSSKNKEIDQSANPILRELRKFIKSKIDKSENILEANPQLEIKLEPEYYDSSFSGFGTMEIDTAFTSELEEANRLEHGSEFWDEDGKERSCDKNSNDSDDDKLGMRKAAVEVIPNNDMDIKVQPGDDEMVAIYSCEAEVETFTSEQEEAKKFEDGAEFIDEGGIETDRTSGEEMNDVGNSDDSYYDKPERGKTAEIYNSSRKSVINFCQATTSNAVATETTEVTPRDLFPLKSKEDDDKCLGCSQIFPSKLASRNHNSVFHPKMKKSSKITRRVDYLNLVKDVELLPWKCSECLRWFSNEMKRNEHERLKHDKLLSDEDLQFPCNQCKSRRYLTPVELSLHKEEAHGGSGLEESEAKFICQTCHARFGEFSRLEFHLGHVHGVLTNLNKAKVRGICPMCGLSCHSLFSLNTHTKEHFGERVFLCELCSATLTSFRYLEMHKEKVHGIYKDPANHPFGCVPCNRVFSSKINFKRHLVYLHEKRKFLHKNKVRGQ